MKTITEITAIIEATNPVSAWSRGVKAYSLELLSSLPIYNNDYINAVLEYANSDKFMATSDRFPVLKWEDMGLDIGCLVMPINNAVALGNLAYVGGILKK